MHNILWFEKHSFVHSLLCLRSSLLTWCMQKGYKLIVWQNINISMGCSRTSIVSAKKCSRNCNSFHSMQQTKKKNSVWFNREAFLQLFSVKSGTMCSVRSDCNFFSLKWTEVWRSVYEKWKMDIYRVGRLYWDFVNDSLFWPIVYA